MLKYPVHFVNRDLGGFPEDLDPDDIPALEAKSPHLRQGRHHWTTQTYLRLKARGRDVRLAPDYVAGQINVVHYDDLALKHRPDRGFIVGIQPDRPRAAVADIRVVQNPLQVVGPKDFFIPFWPQPGLIVRDATRGTRIERIGYLGMRVYLTQALQGEPFGRRLRALGMELVIRDTDHEKYGDLDAVLAVRDVTDFDLSIKPASKLVNAWIAGCPALLGEEPAYRQCRRSKLDYLEVRTPDEAIAALERLKEEPGLYERMVENGRRRAQEYAPERLAERWEQLLGGPVTAAYEAWLGQSGTVKLIRFGWRVLEHKRQRRRFRRLIRK